MLAFDYMVKDHLGNVRATLTDEWQQDNYPAATMETNSAAVENALYTKINDTYTPVSTIANYPASSSVYQPNAAVAKLNKSTQPVGPGILLKVMAGDRINLQCDMWYRTSGATPDNSGTNVFASLLLQLASGVPGASGGHLETGQTGSSGSFFGGPVTDFLRSQPAPAASKPQASVNWLLLDEQFGWQQDNGSGSEAVGDNEVYKHFVKSCSDAIEVQKSGYIYVYTSNQSNIDVYFDNLQVSMVHGPLLEETHYYPFGLTMQGISSKAANKLDNKLKYNNGTELNTDFDISLYETPFREYDPQLGRFNQIDKVGALTAYVSLYAFANNNPTLLNDPTGLTPGFPDDPNWVHDKRMDVIVTPKSAPRFNYVNMGFLGGSGQRDIQKDGNIWMLQNRLANGKPLLNPWDRDSYRESLMNGSLIAAKNKKEKDWEDNQNAQLAALAIVFGPLLFEFAPAASEGLLEERVINTSADFISQMATNNGDITKVNVTSLVASATLPNSPFISSAVASAGQVSIEDLQTGTNSTIFGGTKSLKQFVVETGAGGLGGKLAGRGNNSPSLAKVYGNSNGAKFLSAYTGYTIGNVASFIYTAYAQSK